MDSSKELQELREQIAFLTRRVFVLEQIAGRAEPSAPEQSPRFVSPAAREMQTVSQSPAEPPVPPRGVAPSGIASQPMIPPQSPPDLPLFPDPGAALSDANDLEQKIGTQWLSRVGIIAVLVGMAYFLKLAIDNEWIGPAARAIIGLLAGTGVIWWSERFRARGFAPFSYVLKAIGVGTLYLSIWAAFQLYALLPAGAAFFAMAVVTAATAVLAWNEEAEILAAFSLLGGFLTPLLVSTGQNRQIELFAYIALLDIATVVLTSLRPWKRLLIGSYAGTLMLFFGWYTRFYSPEQRASTVFFATLFFLIFAAAPIAYFRRRVEQRPGVAPALFLVTIANATFYFVQLFAVFEGQRYSVMPWVAVALAALYIALSRMLQEPEASRSQEQERLLHLAIAFGFVTMAIPLKFDSHWITIGWLIESAILLWMARKSVSRFFEALGSIALIFGVFRLVFIDSFATETLLFNARFATFLIVLAALGWYIYLFRGEVDEEGRRYGVAFAVVVWNALALHALHQEIASYFSREMGAYAPQQGPYILHSGELARWGALHEFVDSALLTAYGAGLIAVAVKKKAARQFFHVLGGIPLTLGILRLVFASSFQASILFFNARFVTFVVALAALGWYIYFARVTDQEEDKGLARFAIVVWNALALFALHQEIAGYFSQQMHAYFPQQGLQGVSPTEIRRLRIVHGFVDSALFMLYGTALIALGFWRKSAFLRWQALILIAFTIAKVFAYDLSQLDTVYRVLSFIALGIVLLGVSFVYQRSLLKMKRVADE